MTRMEPQSKGNRPKGENKNKIEGQLMSSYSQVRVERKISDSHGKKSTIRLFIPLRIVTGLNKVHEVMQNKT